MRKTILITMAAIFAVGIMAQQKMRVWKNHALVYEEDVTQIDSITFYDEFEGALNGEFSVSPTKKVRFSKGNLQYNAAVGTHQCADGTTKQGTWRFAEQQYDTINTDYSNLSISYDKWIDRFGWGCSGFNDLMPYCISCYSIESSIANSYYDWGEYVPISNGGSTPGTWRIMTAKEWTYLFLQRDNASARISFCSIDGMGGLLLLPDIWDTAILPTLNLGFNAYNTINQAQWEMLESFGAVFLPIVGGAWPCSGYYTLQHTDNEILYWSADYGYEGSAYYKWSEISGATSGHDPCDKIAVRLVQDVE